MCGYPPNTPFTPFNLFPQHRRSGLAFSHRARVQRGLSYYSHSARQLVWSRAHRATTGSSWGLCEQKGHLTIPSPPFQERLSPTQLFSLSMAYSSRHQLRRGHDHSALRHRMTALQFARPNMTSSEYNTRCTHTVAVYD